MHCLHCLQMRRASGMRPHAAQPAQPHARRRLHLVLPRAGHLRESMAAVNVSSLFDGLFMQTASKLMERAGGGGGKVVAAAAGAAADVARLQEQRPLRTLLAKARDGAGKPVSISVRAELEQVLGAGGSLQALLDGAKPGSLLQLLARDKQVGGQLQRLADTLADAAGRLGKTDKLQQG